MFFVLSHIHVFRHQKRKKKHFWASVSNWAPKKCPASPIRSQKWAQKEPIPSFGVGQRSRACWSSCISLSVSVFVCLGISTSLFSLSVCQHRLRHFLQSCAPVFACGLTNACVGSSSAIKSQSSVPFASESHQTRWQQQLHQVRIELRIKINSRIDQFNRIATAMQNLTTNAPSALSCRASDLIPNNWEGSVEKECTKYTGSSARVDASVVRPGREDASES